MTIVSDIDYTDKETLFSADSTLKSWWDHSHCKAMALTSIGFFWDFRLYTPNKIYKKIVDDELTYFVENINNVYITDGAHNLKCKNSDITFWIANKYYAWRSETKGSKYLTITQISKLHKILQFVENRDNTTTN